MIGRCTNPKNEDFHHYGGRGIKVCERWSKFENFLADMGERPKGKTIERKDVNGDYEKNNCVWASWTEQQRNKRNNVIIEFNGKRQTAAAWAEELNLDHELICSRYRKGWPAEKVLLPPMKPWDCATGRK